MDLKHTKVSKDNSKLRNVSEGVIGICDIKIRQKFNLQTKRYGTISN